MSSPTSRQYFSARVNPDAFVDFSTRATECITEMADRVGLPREQVPGEVERELARVFPRIAFDAIAALGVPLKGAIVVDLGAGLGSASVEASQRGAIPIAVEPGSGWREVAFDRIQANGGGGLVAAVGEALPFRDNSVDIVVSLMVLEHVTD
ncbi:MAG TPA: methyltransferase domain-containing protein, partial [Polyangiaceae bacterium]|nr:methyltransferase domain-containing protein [Polyangiaceae bacterium]